METKTGKIKSVAIKEGKTNNKDWKSYTFEMEDGKKYSTFDEKIGSEFRAGDNVEIEGEQNGKYWNMTSMKKIEGVPVIKPEQLGKGNSENVTFYTSYAKDIFIALLEDDAKRRNENGEAEVESNLMKEAIELVKQARGAFS